jgi:hypothetical protein
MHSVGGDLNEGRQLEDLDVNGKNIEVSIM